MTQQQLREMMNKYVSYKKESDSVNLAEVKVLINNKTYIPDYIDWEQNPYTYPRLKIDVTVDSHGSNIFVPSNKTFGNISIKNVIFNPPATIVFWSDNTKTIVKAQSELYDPEKGIAMAISKKILGDNKAKYYNAFKPWLKKWDKQSNTNIHD